MQSILGALVALAFLTPSNAHSWIEMMNVIAPNGTFTGAPGFARGNCQRAAGVDPDACMVHLLPPNGRAEGNKVLDSDPMCMPSQQTQTQSKDSPRLQAAPGGLVALRYQENGHVTLPQNQAGKPPNRGTVYVYGTTQPDPNDKFQAIHKVWNADGSGGDKRGKLLATQNFDDGQCYQINGQTISTNRLKQFAHDATQPMGQDLWCQNDIALPSDAPSGKPYTLYWVWDWPTAPNVDPGQPKGKAEFYTTCIDVDITATSGTNSKDTSVVKFVDGQSLNSAAIPSYMSALAHGSGNLASTAEGSSAAASQGSSTPAPQGSAPTAIQSSNAPAPAPSPPAVSSPAPPGSSQPAPSTASVPQVSSPQAPGPAGAGPATVTVTASAQPATVTVGAGVPQTPSTTFTTVPKSTVTVSDLPNVSPASATFTGTASVLPASTAAANFQCNSCKMRRQTKILGNAA